MAKPPLQNRITIRRLPDGGRQLTHPSGVVVVETAAHRQKVRAEIVRTIAEMQQSLQVFDAEEATLNV